MLGTLCSKTVLLLVALAVVAESSTTSLCSGEVDVEAEGTMGFVTVALLFDSNRLFATGASTVSVSTVSFLSSSVIEHVSQKVVWSARRKISIQ